jgi:dTDP-4-dehydrorhamnose 3,5-epimerase
MGWSVSGSNSQYSGNSVIFDSLPLQGAYLLGLEEKADERGYFARAWCRKEFEENGLNPRLVQCNLSYNRSAGTLRGMHFQAPPHEEAKVVTCVRGAIYDVIVDLRPDSKTFMKHLGIWLSDDEWKMLYVPEGFAHGFQSMRGDTQVFYQMSEFFEPAAARGFRWNDPAFGIEWPDVGRRIMSERDRSYPDFEGIGS